MCCEVLVILTRLDTPLSLCCIQLNTLHCKMGKRFLIMLDTINLQKLRPGCFACAFQNLPTNLLCFVWTCIFSSKNLLDNFLGKKFGEQLVIFLPTCSSFARGGQLFTYLLIYLILLLRVFLLCNNVGHFFFFFFGFQFFSLFWYW